MRVDQWDGRLRVFPDCIADFPSVQTDQEQERPWAHRVCAVRLRSGLDSGPRSPLIGARSGGEGGSRAA